MSRLLLFLSKLCAAVGLGLFFRLGVGFALRDYWYNIKTGGLAFLIYFTIMLGTDLGFVFSLLKFLRIAPI